MLLLLQRWTGFGRRSDGAVVCAATCRMVAASRVWVMGARPPDSVDDQPPATFWRNIGHLMRSGVRGEPFALAAGREGDDRARGGRVSGLNDARRDPLAITFPAPNSRATFISRGWSDPRRRPLLGDPDASGRTAKDWLGYKAHYGDRPGLAGWSGGWRLAGEVSSSTRRSAHQPRRRAHDPWATRQDLHRHCRRTAADARLARLWLDGDQTRTMLRVNKHHGPAAEKRCALEARNDVDQLAGAGGIAVIRHDQAQLGPTRKRSLHGPSPKASAELLLSRISRSTTCVNGMLKLTAYGCRRGRRPASARARLTATRPQRRSLETAPETARNRQWTAPGRRGRSFASRRGPNCSSIEIQRSTQFRKSPLAGRERVRVRARRRGVGAAGDARSRSERSLPLSHKSPPLRRAETATVLTRG